MSQIRMHVRKAECEIGAKDGSGRVACRLSGSTHPARPSIFRKSTIQKDTDDTPRTTIQNVSFLILALVQPQSTRMTKKAAVN